MEDFWQTFLDFKREDKIRAAACVSGALAKPTGPDQ